MKDRWFVYANGMPSIEAARATISEEGGSLIANWTKVRNRNHRDDDLWLFEISFSGAKALKTSVSDGAQPWKLRFFRLSANMEHPTEDDPNKDEKKSRKVEATKQAVRAAQKARAGRS